MDTIAITATPKGHRIWIQGLQGKGLLGHRYTVTEVCGNLSIALGTEGKRAVTQLKGGIIDLQSKAITKWAAGATEARVTVVGTDHIIIARA